MEMIFEKGDKVKLKYGIKQGAYSDEKGACTCVLWDEMIQKAKEKGILTISKADEEIYRYSIEGLDNYYWTCDMFELVEKATPMAPNVYLVETNDKKEYIMAISEMEALEKAGIKVTFIK